MSRITSRDCIERKEITKKLGLTKEDTLIFDRKLKINRYYREL